jgi:hypothetical protein
VLRFVGRYAAWNGLFGAGVAALAGKIGHSRRLFLERAEPISALADRSVPVASYFFDAARDEFDDRDTAHRDTHRCLAQALLKGIIIAYGRRERTECLRQRAPLRARVATGAHRAGGPRLWCHEPGRAAGDLPLHGVSPGFRGAGRSGVLDHRPGARDRLSGSGRLLPPHRGRDRRAPALGLPVVQHPLGARRRRRGRALRLGHARARLAFDYLEPDLHDPLHQQLFLGFVDFTRDHREFFENVNSP